MSNKRNRSKQKKKSRKRAFKLNAKQKRIAVIVVLLFLAFMLIYGRTIIKLQIENRELRNQQEELNTERNKLSKELKNIHSEDYIKDQARKKLRLMEQDEKIFFFKGDNENEE